MSKLIIDNYRETEELLSVSVDISHSEVDRITVERLIKIRNSEVNKNTDTSFIDKTIRWFLTEEEFQEYVIKTK